MQIRSSNESPTGVVAEALIVPIFADKRLDGPTAPVEKALGGAITRVFADKEIAGKAGETALFRNPKFKAGRVLAIGLGDRAKIKPNGLVKWAGQAVRQLGKRGVTSFAFVVPQDYADQEQAAAYIVEGALTAIIDQTIYRTEPDKPITLEAITLLGSNTKALDKGIKRGKTIGEAVNLGPYLGADSGQRHDADHSLRPRPYRRKGTRSLDRRAR